MTKLPCLLHLPPNWLDHSDERSRDVLTEVANALASLTLLLVSEDAQLLITDWVCAIVSDEGCGRWNWSDKQRNAILPLIREQLSQLIINPRRYATYYPVQDIGTGEADRSEDLSHPLPPNCQELTAADEWCSEAGILLRLHCSEANKWFIGLPCVNAFADGKLSRYSNGDTSRRFPMVGPDEVAELEEAYHWSLPVGIHDWSVHTTDAEKNIHLLGGTVQPETGSSHRSISFRGARTWSLVTTNDVVRKDHLDQLVPITGCELNVIRYVLVKGEVPSKKRFRLPGECLPPE